MARYISIQGSSRRTRSPRSRSAGASREWAARRRQRQSSRWRKASGSSTRNSWSWKCSPASGRWSMSARVASSSTGGEEVALLLALAERLLDGVALERIGVFRDRLRDWLAAQRPEALELDDR